MGIKEPSRESGASVGIRRTPQSQQGPGEKRLVRLLTLWFQEADTNQTGYMEVDEFIAAMKKLPGSV
jgi:hypothetical protein